MLIFEIWQYLHVSYWQAISLFNSFINAQLCIRQRMSTYRLIGTKEVKYTCDWACSNRVCAWEHKICSIFKIYNLFASTLSHEISALINHLNNYKLQVNSSFLCQDMISYEMECSFCSHTSFCRPGHIQ